MGSARSGRPPPRHEVRVTGTSGALSAAAARRAVRLVLSRERAGRSVIGVTMLSSQRMRVLNRRSFGRDRTTDVIAFGLRHDGLLVGDIYLSPAAARRSAARFGVPLREELVRLVVHGTLHVLGYDHPDGAGRTRSAMWQRQERYVSVLERPRP